MNLNRFTTVVSMQHAGESLPAFYMATLPPVQPDDDGPIRAARLRQISRRHHACPVADIDAEIAVRYQQETNAVNLAMTDEDEEDYFE